MLICVFGLACSAFAKNADVKPEGEGTQKLPYQFVQMENFVWLAHQRDKIDAGTTVYCVQIDDIDATETEEWQSFPEIETNNINGENKGAWTLNYDGQGFSIENLCIGQTVGFYSALFALGSFQLKNINITGVKSKVPYGSTGILVGGIVNELDLTTIRVYSDIPTTIYFASIPALVVALILLGFFRKTLGEFHFTYSADIYGDNRQPDVKDGGKAGGLVKGINVTLVLGLMILVIIWMVLFKGVRI